MIKMSENEYRAIDLEFRTRAGRLCRAKYQEVKMLLGKFLEYLERTPILSEYIHGCEPHMLDEEIRAMADRVAENFGRSTFDFGNDTREEIARIYRVFKYVNEGKNEERIFLIGRAFTSDTQFQSCTEGFVHGVVMPFVENINLYLHSIAMNVREVPNKNITITASGNNTQINIANDNASQTAMMTLPNEVQKEDWESLKQALGKMKIAADDIVALRDAIQEERPRSVGDLGSPVKNWIAKMVGKAAEKIIEIPFEVAETTFVSIIVRYFGWS